MDNKIINLALTILFLAALVGAGFFWYKSYPSDGEISALQKGIIPVDKTVFQSPVITQLKARDKNGEIPVVLTKDDIGKTNPFSN